MLRNQTDIIKTYETYFRFGGLPEVVDIIDKRQWLSSLYKRIFFGDLVSRYQIRNDFALRILIRKLAEKVSNKKYYFIDNGLLNLFLIDPVTLLLENQVAIRLSQQYGSNIYFYHHGVEVDSNITLCPAVSLILWFID